MTMADLTLKEEPMNYEFITTSETVQSDVEMPQPQQKTNYTLSTDGKTQTEPAFEQIFIKEELPNEQLVSMKKEGAANHSCTENVNSSENISIHEDTDVYNINESVETTIEDVKIGLSIWENERLSADEKGNKDKLNDSSSIQEVDCSRNKDVEHAEVFNIQEDIEISIEEIKVESYDVKNERLPTDEKVNEDKLNDSSIQEVNCLRNKNVEHAEVFNIQEDIEISVEEVKVESYDVKNVIADCRTDILQKSKTASSKISYCSYNRCQNNSLLCPSLQFFGFPIHSSDLCAKWISNCSNVTLYSLRKSTSVWREVCEEHFTPDSFEPTVRKRLKTNAVPTKLCFDDSSPTEEEDVDDPSLLPVTLNSKTDLPVLLKIKTNRHSLCSVKGCRSSKEYNSLLQFFAFPVDNANLCDQWIINCGNTTLLSLPKSSLRRREVCEKHFTQDSFESVGRKLKNNAVPTIPSSCALTINNGNAHDDPVTLPEPLKVKPMKKKELVEQYSEGKSGTLLKNTVEGTDTESRFNSQENIENKVREITRTTDNNPHREVEDKSLQGNKEHKSSSHSLLFDDVLGRWCLAESYSDLIDPTSRHEETDKGPNQQAISQEDEKYQICSNSFPTLKVQTPVRTYKRTTSKRQRPTNWGDVGKEEGKPGKINKTVMSNPNAPEELNMIDSLDDNKNKTKHVGEYTLFNVPSKPSLKEENSKASTSPSIPNCFERLHSCLYCSQLFTKIKQHIIKKHLHEKELKEICGLYNSLKGKQLVLLTRIGDFKHNTEVLSKGRGILILLGGRCQDIATVGKDTFTPCPDCTGFVHVNNLRIHHDMCLFRDKSLLVPPERNLIVESQAMLTYLKKEEFSNLMQNLSNKLKSMFGTVAKTDELIMLFIPYLFSSKKCQDVSTVLVLIQRFGFILQSYRRIASDQNIKFHHILKPESLPLLSQTLKFFFSQTKLSEKEGLYKCLYSHISMSAFIWRGRCLMVNDVKSAYEALQFFYRFVGMFEKDLNIDNLTHKNVLDVGGIEHSKSSSIAPDDIVRLKNLLNEKIVLLTKKLAENIVIKGDIRSMWHNLTEATMCFLCLTNPVDFLAIEKLKIVEYAVRPDNTIDDLTKYKHLIPTFYRFSENHIFVCTEHLGAEIVILLSSTVKQAIDVLIKKRKEAGVSVIHPNIFTACYDNALSAINSFHNLCVKQGFIPADVIGDFKKRRYISYIIHISEMSNYEMELVEDYLKSSSYGKPLLHFSPEYYYNSELEKEFREALHSYNVNRSTQSSHNLNGESSQLTPSSSQLSSSVAVKCNEHCENVEAGSNRR